MPAMVKSRLPAPPDPMLLLTVTGVTAMPKAYRTPLAPPGMNRVGSALFPRLKT